MKVKAVALLLCGAVTVLCLAGCFGGAKKFRVNYENGKFGFTNARDYYRAGEKVTLYYNLIATDTDYSFFVDDGDVELDRSYDEEKGFVLSFVMPEHDVTVSVKSRNSMVYDGPYFDDEITLEYRSFDGGGPEFEATLTDPSIASYTVEREYSDPDHDEIDGAAYEVIFTFRGEKPGSTTLYVRSFGPLEEEQTYSYDVTVNDDLQIAVESPSR